MMLNSSLVVAVLAMVAFAPSTTHAVCSSGQTDDIVSIICDTSRVSTFGTLCTLLSETGLNSTLLTTSDYFFFAPTNAAFSRAGNRAGVTKIQKTNTLNYHLSSDTSDLSCGFTRSSLLVLRGETKRSITRCDSSGVVTGQEGNVRIPFPSSNFPLLVDPTTSGGSLLSACNGKIAALDNVMGYGPLVYNYGVNVVAEPCSFYSKSCKGYKGYKGSKGSKGGYVVVNEETVGDVTFDNIFVTPMQPKQSKKAKGWSNLNQYQNVYNDNAYNYNNGYNNYNNDDVLSVFSPYVSSNRNSYGGSQYTNKSGKKDKTQKYYYGVGGRSYGLRGKYGKKRNRKLGDKYEEEGAPEEQ